LKQSVVPETHSVYTLEIDRDETSHASVDEICAYFRSRIESHRTAVFIAELDHYAHTTSLPEGQVGEGILAAKNIVYCFGIALPEARCLAFRPRSIGVAETERGFVVTFLEAPMPVANAAVEDWARGLLDR
jgi:hypothetical protein